MDIVPKFLLALLLTITIEVVVVVVTIRYWYRAVRPAISWQRCCVAAILASTLTLPYLWFVLPAWFSGFLPLVLAGEPMVVIVEGFFYWFALRLSFPRALLLSFLANAVSFACGILLQKLF